MRRSTKTRWLLGLALGGSLVLAAVALLPGPLRSVAQPSGPRVVASTTVFADLVRQVGHDRLAAVQTVVPAGVDVEDYNPAPADLRTISQADLFVMNGLAL